MSTPCVVSILHFLSFSLEAIEHYDRERVTNNKGLTVTSQRKFVVFYERLWRDYWNVQGNIGDIPGEAPDSEKWVVPEQPELHLFGVEILHAPEKVLKNVRIRVYKGTNFLPELRYDSGSSRSSILAFECDCKIQGNFKVSLECKKGLFGTARVLELWHNTLFMDK